MAAAPRRFRRLRRAVAPSAPLKRAPGGGPYGDMIARWWTYYAAPSPDSAPFVKVGDRIKKGQVIAILEAMKIMNELEAEFDCKIVSVLVSDGQAVEYDMPLFAVEKL